MKLTILKQNFRNSQTIQWYDWVKQKGAGYNGRKSKIFTYNYSSSQQAEIKSIREKYIPKEENKMDHLRHLDESTTKPGTIVSLIVGIISTLIMGVGTCCCIVWAETLFVPGIIIGVVGIFGIMSAYPLYSHITRKQRKKIAPEILRLTDELMK